MTRDTALAALLGLGGALPLAALLWGFTVDDALITARVASHLALGQGYRFNPDGPVVDAVTPLGFARVLAAAGPADALGMLERARWLGLVAWLGAATYLGALIARETRRAPALLGLLALSSPLAAWASSGMETGLVTALATLALGRGRASGAAAGLAAGLRPELVPWAFALVVGRALASPGAGAPRRLAGAGALALGPALVVALVRLIVFGTALPLSHLAKLPDLDLGLIYAVRCLLWGGIPLLLLAPLSIARSERETRVLVAAVAAHFVALILAGGDWMPLVRLLVPVLPTALLAAARLANHATAPWFYGRALVSAAVSAYVLVTAAWPARTVFADRRTLIDEARPVLSEASVVAAPDVGWVGAAFSGTIVDLAGVTDPVIAALPGGHTSKRIPEALLTDRRADTWVLLLAPQARPAERWQDSRFARWIDSYLAQLPLADRFRHVATLPVSSRSSYVVVRR